MKLKPVLSKGCSRKESELQTPQVRPVTGGGQDCCGAGTPEAAAPCGSVEPTEPGLRPACESHLKQREGESLRGRAPWTGRQGHAAF